MDINKIYNESCLDTMARMPDKFVDMVLTSPPYDNLRAYKGYSFDFEPIAKELFRIIKDGGVLVWVVNDSTRNGSESGTSFRQALYFKEIGFKLYDTMIYAKKNPIPMSHKRYEQHFEFMFVLSKKNPKTFNPIIAAKTSKDGREQKNYNRHADSGDFKTNPPGKRSDKIIGNIWEYTLNGHLIAKERVAYKHPALFPEMLARDHIISWSNEGDLVYDPFMGGGTTAKIALQNNRSFIGSEISKEYCDVIEERLAQFRRSSQDNCIKQ
jgi:DNA modification methylase